MHKLLDDQYFFDNDYWRMADEGVILSTEKWRKLVDTCLRRLKPNEIITMDLLLEVIKNGETKRTYHSTYKKIKRPLGYMSKKQVALRRSEARRRHDNRKPK